MSDAQATLGKAATSIEEIGTARQAAKTLVAALPRILDCRRCIDDKNRLLKAAAVGGSTISGNQAVDMSEVDNAWDSFTAQLQQHDARLDEQKGQLQGQLDRQVSHKRGAGHASSHALPYLSAQAKLLMQEAMQLHLCSAT